MLVRLFGQVLWIKMVFKGCRMTGFAGFGGFFPIQRVFSCVLCSSHEERIPQGSALWNPQASGQIFVPLQPL